MNCRNFHAEKQSPTCPYCVVVALTKALEKIDPLNPALTPAMELLRKAQKEK